MIYATAHMRYHSNVRGVRIRELVAAREPQGLCGLRSEGFPIGRVGPYVLCEDPTHGRVLYVADSGALLIGKDSVGLWAS